MTDICLNVVQTDRESITFPRSYLFGSCGFKLFCFKTALCLRTFAKRRPIRPNTRLYSKRVFIQGVTIVGALYYIYLSVSNFTLSLRREGRERQSHTSLHISSTFTTFFLHARRFRALLITL